MKNKIKVGQVIIDDMGLVYKVVEVFKNSAVVCPQPNDANLSCEFMTFEAMENEGWYIPNL